ncbi:MAG: L-threonylcarbamoyladenylate synthase [Actinomycetota bacterium]|nr:L-threonylcarbamoyladenylate synthase [Actinomycetota bacterium]
MHPSVVTERPDATEIERAAAVVRGGGLVAFPTETVYGLGADAANGEAVARIFAVKGRPPTHPLIVHLAAPDELGRWADGVDERARALADAFWPGPLTMILHRGGRVSPVVTGGRDTVGLRVPAHDVALALLDACGTALAAPSANRFGRVSPTTADDVRRELGDAVDAIVDGGPCRVGVESTIVELVGPEPRLLRPGGVAAESIEAVLGVPLGAGGGPSRAPGMLASHYAPGAAVELVDDATRGERVATLAAEGRRVIAVVGPRDRPPSTDPLVTVVHHAGPDDLARRLYRILRDADDAGADVVVITPPASEGIGAAVVDRLRKAAAPRPHG